eukprot:TRINITY_DN3182_c0_g1_i1.p2 TRINITY_DN3182_c0_g1~~TRINITY_DN3182_c0_g1_i1.p2  ORF type:complete len:152 (-),score=42.09 TRINITY_DN3182_c0_g1_i1:1171-1626(-)
MHFFYIIYVLLVAEISLLALLLLPLPAFLQRNLVSLTSKLRFPARVVLALLTYLCWDAINDMFKHQQAVHGRVNDTGKMYSAAQLDMQIHLLGNKFRSERNFYLVAFTWSILVVIMRLGGMLGSHLAVAERLAKLEASNSKAAASAIYKAD